jgi:IS30 family transposase
VTSRIAPYMINITERLAEAQVRAVPGHWEGALITGKNKRTAMGTLAHLPTPARWGRLSLFLSRAGAGGASWPSRML